MPHCPHCKTEYREGFHQCADCGAPLADGSLPVEETKPLGNEEPPALEDPQWLCTIADEIELGMCGGLLTDAQIPFAVRDHHPAGSYLRAYMGKLTYGQQVFVAASDLANAKELLEGYLAAEPVELPESEEDEPSQPGEGRATRSYQFRNRVVRWGILACVAVAALWIVGSLLLNLSA